MTKTEKADCLMRVNRALNDLGKILKASGVYVETAMFHVEHVRLNLHRKQPAPGRRDGRK